MKSIASLFFILLVSYININAQEKPSNNSKLYNPSADAKKDISNVVAQAKKENKHVFLQIGGNWCGWCIAFDKKVNENPYKEGYVMTYPKEFLDMFFRINLSFKSHYQN